MVQLLRENRIGAVRIDVQLMRELSTHLVIAQRGERSVAGLTGGFATAEGIRGGEPISFAPILTPAKQISDAAGQSRNRIHRMNNHIRGGGNRTYGARG